MKLRDSFASLISLSAVVISFPVRDFPGLNFLILFFFLKIAIFRSPILPPQHAFLAFSKALCDQTLPKTIYASTHGPSHQIMSKAFQAYVNELFPLMKIATSFLTLHL